MKDLKHALRTLLRSPGFTIAALAALTLGIGATTAIFSVINTVLLKPFTYPDTDRIVQFHLDTPSGPDAGGSPTRFNVLAAQTQTFQDVAAYEYDSSSLSLTGGPYPESVHAIHVTASYFHLFGAPLIEGRTFSAEEDRPNGGHVVVLSYGLWQRRFAGDRSVIGRSISLSGVPHTVIGIVAPSFNTELDTPPDVWIPFQIDPNSVDHARYFSIAGRLRPGVTLDSANAQLALATKQFHEKFPDLAGPMLSSLSLFKTPSCLTFGHRCWFWPARCAWCCSSRAPTSPICCWSAPRGESVKWRFAPPSEPDEAVSFASFLPKA